MWDGYPDTVSKPDIMNKIRFAGRAGLSGVALAKLGVLPNAA